MSKIIAWMTQLMFRVDAAGNTQDQYKQLGSLVNYYIFDKFDCFIELKREKLAVSKRKKYETTLKETSGAGHPVIYSIHDIHPSCTKPLDKPGRQPGQLHDQAYVTTISTCHHVHLYVGGYNVLRYVWIYMSVRMLLVCAIQYASMYLGRQYNSLSTWVPLSRWLVVRLAGTYRSLLGRSSSDFQLVFWGKSGLQILFTHRQYHLTYPQ